MSEADLKLLDAYRLSFSGTYDNVIQTIRDHLALEVTGRPAKSTPSVIEKLRRESIRLTQMQDIAGCRLVVPDIPAEDMVVARLMQLFDDAVVIDRRGEPSYGYRAVHVIVERDGRLIEIQIRTSLQHRWAELSEKMSDVVDPTIKYGGGDTKARHVLNTASEAVEKIETLEKQITNAFPMISSNPELAEVRQEHALAKDKLTDIINIAIATFAEYKERDNVLPH